MDKANMANFNMEVKSGAGLDFFILNEDRVIVNIFTTPDILRKIYL